MTGRRSMGVRVGIGAVAAVLTLTLVNPLTHHPASASTAVSDPPITLITGEQVRLAGRAAVLSGTTSRVQTLASGDHLYVVPGEALPEVGRQLDLSLFDVRHPPTDLTVAWQPGATPHPLSGLALGPARNGGSTARVTSPAALAAALDAGPLPGVAGIRATAAGGPTVSPRYNMATLVVKGVDGVGLPSSGTASVINVDDTQRYTNLAAFADGEVSFSVPEGRYTISAEIPTPATGTTGATDSIVILPEVTVTAPETVAVVDASTATVPVSVPQTPLPSQATGLTTALDRVSASGTDATLSEGFFGPLPALYVGQGDPVTVGALHWYTAFRLSGTGYAYGLAYPAEGGPPQTFPTQVDPATLARLDVAYHSDVTGEPIATFRVPVADWERWPLAVTSPATAPLTGTEYVTDEPGMAWIGGVVWNATEFNGVDEGPPSRYPAGTTSTDPYLAAPLSPGAPTGDQRAEPCGACRQGDTLALNLSPWTDPGGHAVSGLSASGTLSVTSDARLYANGQQLAEVTTPSGTFTVPDTPSDLRLTLDTTKSASWTTTTTQSTTSWTWHSTARSGTLPAQRTCPDGGQSCAFEPLLLVGYAIPTDATNAVPAGQPVTLTLGVQQQRYDDAAAADTLSLQSSTDDGTSWTAVPVTATGTGRWNATLTPPAGAGYLSLRVSAADAQADAVEQTIIHAVRVS